MLCVVFGNIHTTKITANISEHPILLIFTPSIYSHSMPGTYCYYIRLTLLMAIITEQIITLLFYKVTNSQIYTCTLHEWPAPICTTNRYLCSAAIIGRITCTTHKHLCATYICFFQNGRDIIDSLVGAWNGYKWY